MICKFFRGGRTYAGAKSAIKYMLDRRRVKKGQAKVVYGNPNITLNIIKNIDNKWKFSSGVMSFEEKLGNMEKREIIEEFKRVFFAGLDEDQYNLLVIEHTDKGRTELHFLTPRIELRTGKALNPYFISRDFKKKDLFQDYVNAKYGLTSPHIAQKQNLTKQPNPNWKRQEIQEWIDTYMKEAIEQGLVQSSQDVQYLLEQAGFIITRQGKDYIGLEIDGKKIRMKGAIYGKNFGSIGELAKNTSKRENAHRGTTQAELAGIKQKLDEIISRQAEYNRKRYAESSREKSQKRIRRDRPHDVAVSKNLEMALDSNTNIASIGNSDGNLDRQIHHQEKILAHQQERVGVSDRPKNGMVCQKIEKRRRVDDRNRVKVNRIVRARENRQRKRDERTQRYAKRAKQIAQEYYRTVTELEQAISRRKARISRIARIRKVIESNANRIKEMMLQELEKFKREVNIAEVAQLFGYYIDKEKSSRAVKQLRNDSTGDKIVVSRNEKNEHYVYFSMRNNDSGTIIDFLQARTGKNLGEVRIWLRKWLKGEIDGYEQVKIQKSSVDRNKIYRIWEDIENNGRLLYGGQWRGIHSRIWEEIAEKGRVKITDDNVYFPMYDLEGICGIEKRGLYGTEKRVIAGSQKGIWTFGSLKEAKHIIVCESPIDAISYLILQKAEFDNVFLVATMGAFGAKQEQSIREIAKRNQEAEWILAMDKDEAGKKMAQKIAEIVKDTNKNANVYRHQPQQKDWNEELQQQQQMMRRSRGFSLGR